MHLQIINKCKDRKLTRTWGGVVASSFFADLIRVASSTAVKSFLDESGRGCSQPSQALRPRRNGEAITFLWTWSLCAARMESVCGAPSTERDSRRWSHSSSLNSGRVIGVVGNFGNGCARCSYLLCTLLRRPDFSSITGVLTLLLDSPGRRMAADTKSKQGSQFSCNLRGMKNDGFAGATFRDVVDQYPILRHQCQRLVSICAPSITS